ncbi:hypothetical protein NDU88_003518 [Pleurodeles waltl]|uniref:Uncharacterized protein n=1 Tax=Pleurodeles waltl TaxID=8319 RepID=A0AAV7NKX0_PLEWA|nr:hypothetical protein NDU88_003518 [Pleurodeles waltl]
MFSTSVLVVQRYFLAMGVGPAPTPLMARTPRRALERPIRCTTVYPPQCRVRDRPTTSSASPLGAHFVPRSLFPSVTSSLWVLGPHRPRQRIVLSFASSAHVGAFIRCTAACSPPSLWEAALPVLYKSPGALLRASFLIPQCYFLDVDAGPVSAAPVARSLHRALSTHRRTVACSLLGQGEATPRCTLQVPLGCTPYLSPCSPALLTRWAHKGALSDALQRVLCPSGGRPPLNDLYNYPGGTSILVVGARPAPTPPADRALRRTLSA